MKALILAGGYGTRLYPITVNIPKALVMVNNKPIIDYILEKINQLLEIDEIFIVTNNRFYPLLEEWAKTAPTKKTIKVLNDGTNTNEERLGALGDMMFGLEKAKINDTALIIASDNIFDFDLRKIMKEKDKDIVAVVEVNLEDIKRYGVVELSDVNGKKLVGFEEKPAKPKTNLASTGVYIFQKETLQLVDMYKAEGNSMEGPGFFLQWLYKRKDVYACVYNGKWFDIGTIEMLVRANEEFR